MKKGLIVSAIVGTLLFTGCASNGIGMNTGNSSIQQNFEIGSVASSQKVLIERGHLNTIGMGALAGAAGGAALGSRASSQHALNGGLIGLVVGAGAGLVTSILTNGNEVEAFQIQITDKNNKSYRTYVEYDLPIGTIVEYIVRPDGTLTNIDVKRPGKKVNNSKF